MLALFELMGTGVDGIIAAEVTLLFVVVVVILFKEDMEEFMVATVGITGFAVLLLLLVTVL